MRLQLRGCGCLITTVAILTLWTSCSSDFQPVIPDMALDGMEPQVVAKITRLKDSVTTHPHIAELWGRLAMNLYVHELMAEAAQCFENASELNRVEFRWPYFCAIALQNLGRQESLNWYLKAVKIRPDEPQLMEASKRLLQLEDDEPSADPILNEMAGEGVSFHWFMERGGRLLEAQQPGAAAAEFRRALKIRPEASAYSQLGIAMANLGKPDSAISLFRKACALNPKSALHSFNLGFALCDHGYTGEGIRMLEQAHQLSPQEERYASTLFDQYVVAGRWSDAAHFGSRVYGAAPENSVMGLRLAWLLSTCPSDKLRRGKESVKIAESIVQGMHVSDPEALDCLAAAYAENGQYDLATRTIARAIQLAESAGEYDRVSKFRERERRFLQGRPWRSDHSFRQIGKPKG